MAAFLADRLFPAPAAHVNFLETVWVYLLLCTEVSILDLHFVSPHPGFLSPFHSVPSTMCS